MNFIKKILNAYSKLYKEIGSDKTKREGDLVPRFIHNIFFNALGYSEKDYEQEKDWNDVKIYDLEKNTVVIIENKARNKSLDSVEKQAFKYASRNIFWKYLLITNIDKLKLYEKCNPEEEGAIT